MKSSNRENSIMLIADGKSIIIRALCEHFEGGGYSVIRPDIRINAINDSPECGTMVVYTDPSIIDDAELLTFIADYVRERDMLIYIIGTPNEIDIQRESYRGVNIRLVFERPINAKEVGEAICLDISENASKLTKKILVIDDSGTMLRKIKGWLEDKYSVTLANSGARAMKSLATEIPDLILLDYEMPIVDGGQVLEMIKSDPDYEDIPVIFLTGKSDRETVMKVMALKPAGYLLKNQEASEIISQIDAFFEKMKSR